MLANNKLLNRVRASSAVVMVADVENQRKPLISLVEMKEVQTESLQKVLRGDDGEKLRQEISRHGRDAVLMPTSSQDDQSPSALHLAVTEGAKRCLAILLDPHPTKNILEAPDKNGQTPLLLAVELAMPDIIKQLLKVEANPNARNDKGFTSLHHLVHALDSGKLPEDDLLNITDILLSNGGVDLESHYRGLTPLAYAACRLPQGDGAPRRGGLLTFCKKLVEHGASLHEKTGEGTVEEVLQRKRAMTSILMGERRAAPPRPKASHFLDLIHANTKGPELEKFLKGLSSEDAKAAASSRLGKETVLFTAVKNTNESLVKTLVDHKVDPWMMELTNELPLHRAAAIGHYPIFDLLITKMKGDSSSQKVDLKNHTVSLVQKVMENWKRKQSSDPKTSHEKCFFRLLEPDVELDVNQEQGGTTAAHVAASFNKQEAVSELLQRGAFLGARPLILKDRRDPLLTTLRPATLKAAMDGCIKHLPQKSNQMEDEAATNIDYTLLLDYRFLVPPTQPQHPKQSLPEICEVETLMDINRSRVHRHVITHPLVQTLLYAKWRKALPFYLFNLVLYFLFVFILTFFVYNLRDLRVLEAHAEKLTQAGINANATVMQEIDHQQTTVTILMAFLFPLTLYMLVREIFQVVFSRMQYLKNIENFLEWFLIVAVVLLSLVPFSAHFTSHLAAWAMIVAWYEFVLILGRAPPLALYITMLRHVSLNFFKFIFLFGALIIAFTISFNIILQDVNEEFREFGSTLPKAIVMSTGEFEYSSLGETFTKDNFGYAASAILIFLVFLFLIFLVLMNVMNGMAVTDTKDVMDDALLYSLTSRLELVYLVERLLLRCPPFLKSHLGRLQLLSGSSCSPRLLAKINRPNKHKRLWAGKISEETSKHDETYLSSSKLDGDTTECLRNHRLAHLEAIEAQEQQRRSDSLVRLEGLVRQMVEEQRDPTTQKQITTPGGQ